MAQMRNLQLNGRTKHRKMHKVPQDGTGYHTACKNTASVLRFVDYTSNHLPISSVTENKRYAATEALDNT